MLKIHAVAVHRFLHKDGNCLLCWRTKIISVRYAFFMPCFKQSIFFLLKKPCLSVDKQGFYILVDYSDIELFSKNTVQR